jgi:hypothetical protein
MYPGIKEENEGIGPKHLQASSPARSASQNGDVDDFDSAHLALRRYEQAADRGIRWDQIQKRYVDVDLSTLRRDFWKKQWADD